MKLLLVFLLVLPGCAYYKVRVDPQGVSELVVLSTREFPEGMKTKYKEFLFEANSVSGGLTMEDVYKLAKFLQSKGVPITQ